MEDYLFINQEVSLLKSAQFLSFFTNQAYEPWLQNLVQAQGYIFVYDVYSRESFDYYAVFREALIRLKQTERVPMILVSFTPIVTSEQEKEVSAEEGLRFHQSMLFCDCIDCLVDSQPLGKKLAELGGFPFREVYGTDASKISEVFMDLLNEVLTSYVGKAAQPASWSFDAGSGEIIELERIPECSIVRNTLDRKLPFVKLTLSCSWWLGTAL